MRYRLQRHDGTDCSATMVPITVLRMVPIQRYRQNYSSQENVLNNAGCVRIFTHKISGKESKRDCPDCLHRLPTFQ